MMSGKLKWLHTLQASGYFADMSLLLSVLIGVLSLQPAARRSTHVEYSDAIWIHYFQQNSSLSLHAEFDSNCNIHLIAVQNRRWSFLIAMHESASIPIEIFG